MTDETSPLDREEGHVRVMRRRLMGISLILLIGFMGVVAVLWFLARGERTVQQSHSATLVQESRNAAAVQETGRALRLAVLASRDTALAPVSPSAQSQLVATLQAMEWVLPLEGHEDRVSSATFSPDGTRIVTTSEDRTARVWTQAVDSAWSWAVLEGHEDIVLFARFAPDGRHVITVSKNIGRVWDIAPLWDDAERARWNRSNPQCGIETSLAAACSAMRPSYLG